MSSLEGFMNCLEERLQLEAESDCMAGQVPYHSGGCDKQLKMWPLSGGQTQTVATHHMAVSHCLLNIKYLFLCRYYGSNGFCYLKDLTETSQTGLIRICLTRKPISVGVQTEYF